MNLDEAEKLARNTDYAVFASEQDPNPINFGDAAAFFLEGYEYAKKQGVFSEWRKHHGAGDNCWCPIELNESDRVTEVKHRNGQKTVGYPNEHEWNWSNCMYEDEITEYRFI
jgi:hypothetical protein